MPTITSEPKTENTVTFRSKDPTLTLVRRQERRRYNERGELEILEGKRYSFTNGLLHLSDEDDIKWLREHRLYNRRFHEVGNEPGREKPTVDEALTEIATAAAQGNAEGIAAIYEREVATYDREVVKRTAQKSLEAMEKVAEGGQLPAEAKTEG